MRDKIKNKSVFAVYAAVASLFAGLFFFQLYPAMRARFFEMDLLWMIPTAIIHSSGKSFIELARFFMNSEVYGLGSPVMKMFFVFVTGTFGPQPLNYTAVLILIHCVNSLLLAFFARNLGFERMSAFFAALVYFCFYPHSESYFWAGNIQHIFVVLAVLSVLNLYLRVDSLMDEGGKWRRWYFPALAVNLLFTFLCRVTVMIIPVVIMSHVFSCRVFDERRRKFDIWLPLFASYLFYPLCTLVFAGDDRLMIPALSGSNIPVVLVYFLAVLAGIAALAFLRAFISWKACFANRRERIIVIGALAAVFCFLSAMDKANVLLPVNFFLPFAGMTGAFLRPIASVFMVDSAQLYSNSAYRVFLPLDLSVLILTAGMIFAFLTKTGLKRRAVVILLGWYSVCVLFPWLRFTLVPMRYVAYISPVFCVVFASALVGVLSLALKRLKPALGAIVVSVVLFPVLLLNIGAVKLEMARNKMITSAWFYDYIKTASLIKDDLFSRPTAGRVNLSVSGITPLVVTEACEYSDSRDLCRCSQGAAPTYYNFRFIMAQELGIRGLSLDVNPGQDAAYSVKDGKVYDSGGRNIDEFDNALQRGISFYRSGEHIRAEDLLERAIRLRPSVIAYIMDGFPAQDAHWLTSPRRSSLRGWLADMFDRLIWESCRLEHRMNPEKLIYVKNLVMDDVDGYIRAVFLRSYLSYKSGDLPQCRLWFSKIVFVENDPAVLLSLLKKFPEVKDDKDALYFLEWICSAPNLAPLTVPESGSMERLKFLARFLGVR